MEARLRLWQYVDNLPPLQQILIYPLLAFSYVYRGDHRECHRMVNESLDIAKKTGIHIFDFMIISSSAFSWLGIGDLIQVPPILGKLKAALTSYAVWDHAQYHWLVAWHAIQADNVVEAQDQIETAVKLVNICGNHFTVALCSILQSQIFLELGEPQKSENLLAAVQNEPQLRNSKIIHFLVNLAYADSSYEQNLTIKAELYCQAAFAAAREEGGIWMPLSLSNRRLGAVCARALEAEIEENTVVEMIRRWQLKPPDPVIMSERWPWPVRIYALGRFEIYCDGKLLTLSAKTPRKPLELLTILICAGQAGVFREAVARKLWPDSDGDLALQTLNTTLHRLRKLLGNNETVVQKGSQLFLNRNLCWIDCRYFQWQVQQIESTAHQDGAEWFITQALALYQGPFTTGHEHLSVAVGYSSQLSRQWLNVVAAAVPLFIRPDTGNETKRAVQQALSDDDTAAAVFRILVSTFNKSGRDIEALDILHRCRSLMDEQGISCDRKTMAFFSNLQQK
jgi:LuxR family transcriptional regulator, maltose regulon positive regulatory protein